MLPGYIAQYYSFDECHIDLPLLANFAGAQFVHAEASDIDAEVSVSSSISCPQ